MSAWIPVSDRLPDSDEIVLIAVPAASEPVWLAWYDDESQAWMWEGGADVIETVTHWRPLPEPPATSHDTTSTETRGCGDYARCVQILRDIVKDGLGGRISQTTWDSVMRELKNASKEKQD